MGGTRVRDDLFRHVHGEWLDGVVVPRNESSAGVFLDLVERVEGASRVIAERLAGGGGTDDDGRRIGDLYASFLDEERIEALGTGPLRERLTEIAAVDSPAALARMLGRLERDGVPGAFGVSVTPDARDSGRYVVYLAQAGLGLPDEAYYRQDAFAGVLAEYREHVARMLALAGSPDPGGAAARITALEGRLAAAHWDRVSTRDDVRGYTLLTGEALAALAPAFDWDAWREGLGHAPAFPDVVVRQPDYLAAFSAAVAEVPLADWRAWLAWRLVGATAPLLGAAFVREHFAFHGAVLSGVPRPPERWRRGLALVDATLGEAFGRYYVAEHFPPRSRRMVRDLVGDLQRAHAHNIRAAGWMSASAKEEALRKLAAFTAKIGYPDRVRDYGSVVIDRADLVGNVRRARAAELDRALASLGGPVDRDEWDTTPRTVNAYNIAARNEIVFPAAILQPPFFDPDADPAVNYGAIGAVIGHEIGHGFDDQGSRYDGTGTLRDWWTPADRAAYDAMADALVRQYDVLEPAQTPGRRVNGRLTLSENIGDLVGLTMAHTAYVMSLDGAEPPVVDGLTGHQRFFLGWAYRWGHFARDEEVVRRLSVDPHAPPEIRCNAVVRHLDAFHDAFGVREGDGMWLAPDDRVRIW